MGNEQHHNKSARRRAQRDAAKRRSNATAEDRNRNRVRHRSTWEHSNDTAAVLSQLESEAAGFGLEELIRLTDEQLADIDDDMILAAQHFLSTNVPVEREETEMLSFLVTATCMAWGRADPARDESAVRSMIRSTGMFIDTVDNGDGTAETSFGVVAGSVFSSVSTIIANRLALINR